MPYLTGLLGTPGSAPGSLLLAAEPPTYRDQLINVLVLADRVGIVVQYLNCFGRAAGMLGLGNETSQAEGALIHALLQVANRYQDATDGDYPSPIHECLAVLQDLEINPTALHAITGFFNTAMEKQSRR